MWSTLFDYQLSNAICHCVHVFDIQIQAEGIVFDILRPPRSIGQMEVPASAVFEDPIMTIVTDDREFQTPIKRFTRVEIAAWYDRNGTMFHFSTLHE